MKETPLQKSWDVFNRLVGSVGLYLGGWFMAFMSWFGEKLYVLVLEPLQPSYIHINIK